PSAGSSTDAKNNNSLYVKVHDLTMTHFNHGPHVPVRGQGRSAWPRPARLSPGRYYERRLLAFLMSITLHQAANRSAASSKRLRSRSPLAADLRMRSASTIFGTIDCSSGVSLPHASSRTSFIVATVSGSKYEGSLPTMMYRSRWFRRPRTILLKTTTVRQ